MTTSKNSYKIGYQPLMPGVYVTPFPYALRYGLDEEKASQWCLDELVVFVNDPARSAGDSRDLHRAYYR